MPAVREIAIDQAAEDAAFLESIRAAAKQETDPAIKRWLGQFVAAGDAEAKRAKAVRRAKRPAVAK